MKKLSLLFLLCMLCPVVVPAQQHEGLANILTAVLESAMLQPYLPHDSLGNLTIHYLIAGKNVPTGMTVKAGQVLIPVASDEQALSGNLLKVVSISWKVTKAKVVLRGPGDFLARYRLRFENDQWQVARAFIRGVALRNGKKHKSWDVKL